jgi:hypothetical protein
MVKLLLENGADANYRVRGFTAMYYANQDIVSTKQYSDPKIEALLKQYGGHD